MNFVISQKKSASNHSAETHIRNLEMETNENPVIFNIIRWDDGMIVPLSDGPKIIL